MEVLSQQELDNLLSSLKPEADINKKKLISKYEIVDKLKTLYDYLDNQIESSEIHVINLDLGEICSIEELFIADFKNDDIIFIKRTRVNE